MNPAGWSKPAQPANGRAGGISGSWRFVRPVVLQSAPASPSSSAGSPSFGMPATSSYVIEMEAPLASMPRTAPRSSSSSADMHRTCATAGLFRIWVHRDRSRTRLRSPVSFGRGAESAHRGNAISGACDRAQAWSARTGALPVPGCRLPADHPLLPALREFEEGNLQRCRVVAQLDHV